MEKKKLMLFYYCRIILFLSFFYIRINKYHRLNQQGSKEEPDGEPLR